MCSLNVIAYSKCQAEDTYRQMGTLVTVHYVPVLSTGTLRCSCAFCLFYLYKDYFSTSFFIPQVHKDEPSIWNMNANLEMVTTGAIARQHEQSKLQIDNTTISQQHFVKKYNLYLLTCNWCNLPVFNVRTMNSWQTQSPLEKPWVKWLAQGHSCDGSGLISTGICEGSV